MAWTAPRTWVTGELVTASIMNTHVRDNLIAAGEGEWLHDIDVFGTAISHVNWDTTRVLGGNVAVYGATKDSSGAQNDEINWDRVLIAGTWTVELMYEKDPNMGIFSVQFDGVEKGTIDGYTAGTSFDNRSSVTGIVVATTGKVRLKLKMATKNASSASYYGRIQHVQLRRTA